MKVLHLSGGGDIGGAKSHILSLVSELQKHIPVCLVSLRNSDFSKDAKDMGIDVRIIKTHFILTDLFLLIRLIRRERFDIVHAHGSKANMMMVLARFFISFIPVSTIHSDYRLDYLHSTIKKYTFGVINRVALAFIGNYVAVSANFKKMLIERGFPPSRLHVVYNGISFDNNFTFISKDQFLLKYNINANPSDILVGIVARLHPVKGVEVFIKAAAEAFKTTPNMHFIICGDGDQRTNLENLAKSLSISDNVHFLGHISAPWEALQNLDINVLSSHSESFPYSILEGAYYSLPTISSDVGGISDLIEHGITGYLFTPGDFKKLAALISDFANNPQNARALGRNLNKRAKENFSLQSMCKTQIDIYNKLINRKIKRAKYKYEYDIVLSGYYGFKNSGDDAILLAIIQNLLKENPELNLLIMSASPLETCLTYNIDSVNRFNLFTVIRSFKRSLLFIYGGGNLLQDDTSTRSLFYYLGMTLIARACGLKVMLYASGIGPIYKPSNKRLTNKVINNVELITLRENLSMQKLADLGITRPKIEVTADPVLTISPIKQEKINLLMEEAKLIPGIDYLGISMRNWKNFENHSAAVAHMADYAYIKYGLIPVFIPMQHPDDLVCLINTVSKMKSPYVILKNKYTIPELLGIISRMKAVVGMRLHALIYAANTKVPMIGLSYDSKVSAFMQMVGLPEYATSPLDSLQYEDLISLIDKLMENRDIIIDNLHLTIPQLTEKAYKSAIYASELLSDILHNKQEILGEIEND